MAEHTQRAALSHDWGKHVGSSKEGKCAHDLGFNKHLYQHEPMLLSKAVTSGLVYKHTATNLLRQRCAYEAHLDNEGGLAY